MPKPASAKLHPLLVRAVAQSLHAIFREDRHADKIIEQTLRQNPKAGSRDRAFIAETTYDIVRYYRLYTEVLGKTPKREADFWEMIGAHLVLSKDNQPGSAPEGSRVATPLGGGVILPPWAEFKNLNPTAILSRAAVCFAERRFRESIPDWLDALGETELGAQWEPTIHALNQTAQVVLRANRLRTDREALRKELLQEGVTANPIGEGDALVLERRQNIFQTKAFRAGLFEVQDFSSQQVAALLDPQPGQRVVDACAGAGGKSLHLSALMQGKGLLIALDTVAWKLEELRTRARRAGAVNIETRPIESRKVIKRLHDSADRLLLDVPCSGLGVLRRNPDAKWKLSMESIEQLRSIQGEILRDYSAMLRQGGRMVYATCSILPSENEQQVAHFLGSEAGGEFRLISERRILPQDEGFDGFYMALLERV